MEKKLKGLLQLSAVELMAIPSAKRRGLVQTAAVRAIKYSVLHNDTSQASLLLKMLPEVTTRSGAKKSLIDYLVKWGNLRYGDDAGKFKVARNLRPDEWTDAYEASVSKHRWDEAIETTPPSKPPVVDAEVEIRKLVEKLERIGEEPGREVIHAFLISKIRALLFEYGTSSLYDAEVKRGRTLFDASTARRTVRAGKYAKGA
jgi:hypothetical protein